MPSIEAIVTHEVGLHARPAAKFVELAASFACEVTLRNLTQQGAPSNAKSILGVLAAGVRSGDRIAIQATGEQAEAALAALQQLILTNFGAA